MENSTRLLWRQEESLAGRRVLVVDANDPELADLPAEQVYLHADDYTVGAHQWAPLPTLPEDTDLVILPLPKSSERLELLLRGLAGSVEEPLEVWLVGPAKGGILKPVVSPEARPLWPEAFYIVLKKTRLSYTLEAPSNFPMATRVNALCTAVQTLLASHLTKR